MNMTSLFLSSRKAEISESIQKPISREATVRSRSGNCWKRQVWKSWKWRIQILVRQWHRPPRESFPAACSTGGYPLVKQGSKGVYVLIAQDGLNTLGYTTGGLDGVFGTKTKNAVIRYQRSRGLSADGIIGCNTWRSLQENVIETGRTSTTIN